MFNDALAWCVIGYRQHFQWVHACVGEREKLVKGPPTVKVLIASFLQ